MSSTHKIWASQMTLVVKNLPSNARNIRDVGLIPGLGRSTGGGHSNPLQYYCLENCMDKGAWQATVHRVAQNPDMTEASKHACKHTHMIFFRYVKKWENAIHSPEKFTNKKEKTP